MKWLFLLLATGCASIPIRPETSAIIVNNNNKFLEHMDTVYVGKKGEVIRLMYYSGYSKHLKPTIYLLGGVNIQDMHPRADIQSPAYSNLQLDTNYEWKIRLQSNKDGIILFILENKHKMGHSKMIIFKNIKR